MLGQRVHGVLNHPLSVVRVPGIQQVYRVKDNAQVGALNGAQHLHGPVRVVHDVLPHRLDGQRHAQALGPLHHRGQVADKGVQSPLGVGGCVGFVLGVGGPRLGAHHPRPHEGGHAQMAVVPALDVPQPVRVGMGQVQVAPQHRRVQLVLGKNPPDVHGQPFGEGALVKGHARDYFGQGQMNARKALLPGGLRPALQGLGLRGQGAVYVVQSDAKLHGLFLPLCFVLSFENKG